MAVEQEVHQQRVGGHRCERDPEHRLRPVDRAHEAADGDEPQRRRNAPDEPEQILLAEARRLRRLPEREQDLLAVQRQEHDRDRYQEGHPQAGTHGAAHLARIARAKSLRGKGCYGRDQAKPEGEADEEHGVAERRGCHRVIAEPSDEGEIGRHHRDLAELRHRHRRCEPDGLRQLSGEMILRRCQLAGALDLVEGSHGTKLSVGLVEMVAAAVRSKRLIRAAVPVFA